MKNKNSFRMIRKGAVALVAVAAVCLMSQSANAQGCGYGGGGYYGGGGGIGFSSGYRGGYGGGLNVNINRGYGGLNYGYQNVYRQPRYHTSSRYGYHPGSRAPHRGQFNYAPNRYDPYRSGHRHR